MPDSPPQAIHGLLSAYPGRDAALAIRCRGFVVGKRSAEVYAKVSRVLAAGGRDKRAMDGARPSQDRRSEEHTSELQSLMRNSYADFCLTKKKQYKHRRAHLTSINRLVIKYKQKSD